MHDLPGLAALEGTDGQPVIGISAGEKAEPKRKLEM